MHISDIPEFRDKKETLTITKSAKLSTAVKRMAEHNYGSIVIVNKSGKLEGIVTERDILIKVAAEDKDISKLKVSDVMTSDVKTANINDSVPDSLRRMTQGRFRHLPVVDDNNKVVGIVSQGDFVAYTWPQILQRVASNAKVSFFSAFQPFLIVIAIVLYTVVILSAVAP